VNAAPSSHPDAFRHWQIVIFLVGGKANHAGLSIPGHGLGDLSLRGARVVPWDAPSLPKGEPVFFDITLAAPARALTHLQRPGLLTAEIIRQEKAAKGWHLTDDAPDFIRTLRSARSRDPDDMNCVEWIVHALELGGLDMPPDLLTPTDLMNWCRRESLPESLRIATAAHGAAPAASTQSESDT
jgi:hypothetical protein